MKLKASLIFFWFLCLSTFHLEAQAPDSTGPILNLEMVRQRVLDHHPIALQASLLTREAESSIRMARGGFDPKAYAEWASKSFKDTEYYTYSESGLKVPSWYGLEFKAAYETSRGVYVDPERNLPAVGQAIAGVKISALRGMIIDERRATLQQARLLQAQNEAERRWMLNELLWETTKAYWEWWASYQQWQIYQRALENAQQRQVAIVTSFEQGDKPAIDSLESFVQIQNRTLEVQQAEVEYRKATLMLSNYLWEEGEVPLEIEENTTPETFDPQQVGQTPIDLGVILSNLDNTHPELRQSQLKISGLEIDRRLAAEQLKPKLDLEYNFLGSGFDFTNQNGNDATLNNLITENYKLGISFETSLFLRKERGKLQLTKLKIQDAGYGLQQKRLNINNKIMAYFTEWQITRDQLTLYNETVVNYQRLLDAELQKFNIGESSIFLINSRENKLIEAQLKLIKLQSTLPKLDAGVQWAAGTLY